ncbi:MAG: O-antigen ligase family protein [Pseudomonadota bacterium]
MVLRALGDVLNVASERFDLLTGLLALVVASSLVLLLFGLSTEPGRIEILQLPTTLTQIFFVFVAARQKTYQTAFMELTRAQHVLIGVLIAYVAFISFSSDIPSASAFGLAWIVHVMFFVAVVLYARLQVADVMGFIWLVCGIVALGHVAAFLFAWALWPEQIRANHLPAFDNVRHLGYFLAPVAAVMAVQTMMNSTRLVLPVVCYGASVFYLIHTGSRGGAVAFIAGLAVISCFCIWQRQRVRVTGVAAMVLVTVLVSVFSLLSPTLPWLPLFERGAAIADQTGTQMLSGRADVWRFAAIAISQNVVFGYGPGLMGQIPEYLGSPFRHPHNIGLQLMLHWGAIGTLIMLATVSAFIPNLIRALKRNPSNAVLPFVALVTMIVHSLVDGGLFYPYSVPVAIIAFAMLEGLGHQTISQENEPAPS